MSQNVSFEFLGGPHDGLVIEGATGGPQLTAADSLLRDTEGGKPGAEVWIPTPYAVNMLRTYSIDTIEQLSLCGYRFPGHSYEVFVRRRSGAQLIIRARHLGAAE